MSEINNSQEPIIQGNEILEQSNMTAHEEQELQTVKEEIVLEDTDAIDAIRASLLASNNSFNSALS